MFIYFYSIIQQMLRSEQQEMVQYLSQFFSEITVVVNELKKYLSTLISVDLPASIFTSVPSNASALAAAANRTFKDINNISSIIKGYSKSQIQLKSMRSSKVSKSRRSRSQHSTYCKENRLNDSVIEENASSIKNQSIATYQNSQKQKSQKSHPEGFRLKHENFSQKVNEIQKSVEITKVIDEVSKQSQPFDQQKTNTQAKWSQLLSNNQTFINNNIARNNDCLQLIKDIKRSLFSTI